MCNRTTNVILHQSQRCIWLNCVWCQINCHFKWFSIDLNLDLERRVCLSIKRSQWIFTRQHHKKMHQCAFSSFIVFWSTNRAESPGWKWWSGEVNRIFSQKCLFGQKCFIGQKRLFGQKCLFSQKWLFGQKWFFSQIWLAIWKKKLLDQKWQWIRIEIISYILVRMAFLKYLKYLTTATLTPKRNTVPFPVEIRLNAYLPKIWGPPAPTVPPSLHITTCLFRFQYLSSSCLFNVFKFLKYKTQVGTP